ncbi:MAG: PTS lactose/cellobiose transporter subunit IIA [Erysipelotrichaceae bacterium]|nr:PTS lactose/cellobiose transporter subunit IIA [Erysipelotrichaceae bacterium]
MDLNPRGQLDVSLLLIHAEDYIMFSSIAVILDTELIEVRECIEYIYTEL